ncbi:hypothetical protein C0993_005040 [Termitomyces sp. T159_Od127]|nr:hypothetical protein C0993_005040 [Termitomyces sp. T159_Od127]
MKDFKRNSSFIATAKTDFGFIWMTVPKNYRESSDDGIFTGLLLGPLIAAGLLISALRLSGDSSLTSPLPQQWRIEAPAELHNIRDVPTAMDALVRARYNLVDLGTFCSTILLLHVCASWYQEYRCLKRGNTAEGERTSVPRSEGRRSLYYILFALGVTSIIFGLKVLLQWQNLGLWERSFFTLYVAIRLAHRVFTLGELGLVCFGGTAVFMEFFNITIAKIRPVTTPFIKTYRLPTPLLTFQIALIAGSLLTGFLLSPFLVLSRHIAQRPVRRLRNPQDKPRNRRLLALGFYTGTVIIIGGVIGMWTRWCLGKRDPWLWVIFWLLEGKRKWTRPALVAYWAALGSLSVAGWNRQLARSRRYWHRNSMTSETLAASTAPDNTALQGTEQPGAVATPVPGSSTSSPSVGVAGMTFPALPALPTLPSLPNGTQVASDLLDAADKHVPTLGLNARRKFFHALAVVMFIPGIAIDVRSPLVVFDVSRRLTLSNMQPAFTHLSFSAAFALFVFTEYVRYFAIYPFGAAVHLFMNEFLDHRDRGTAILSHFYLLTGCAGSVWLEGPSQLLQFTGILTLGVGDAMVSRVFGVRGASVPDMTGQASIVGKRIGCHRWSPTTSKTLEGSVAFTVSIAGCAWLLRLLGVAETFSVRIFGIDMDIARSADPPT